VAAVSVLDFAVEFPAGQTVTLVTRTLADEKDADGNDVYTETTTDVPNVPVWPRGASELVQGQDTTITGLSCLLPPDVDVTAIDAVKVNGSTYEVDGEPQPYRDPFTGLDIGHQVDLTRVEG